MNTAESYVRHPNSYLPKHSYNIHSETDGESIPLNGSSNEMITTTSKSFFKNGASASATNDDETDDDDEIPAYGFPALGLKRRNRVQKCDVDPEFRGEELLIH